MHLHFFLVSFYRLRIVPPVLLPDYCTPIHQVVLVAIPEIVIPIRQMVLRAFYFQKLLSQSVRWFSGHFTSRNCCPNPSGDFQDILLPEILIRSIKWVQGILLLTYHYYIYGILFYDYLNYFVFSLRISYHICVIPLLLLLIVFCSLYHCL